MKNGEKKVVSPFEFAITEIADPEAAKNMRPETREEQEQRRIAHIKETASKIKVKALEK